MFNRISIALLFVIFIIGVIGCESSTKYQNKQSAYNKPSSLESKKKFNNLGIEETYIVNNDISFKKNLNIGLMLPISGEHYQIGRSLLNSAQLAIETTDNKNIIFSIIDTGNEDKILNDLFSLLKQDIDIFIGPVFSNNINLVKEVIKDKEIPIITLSNNSKLEDNQLYVFGLTLEDEINRLLNYSLKNNLRKYTVLIPNNDYGNRVEQEIIKFKLKNNSMTFNFIFYDSKSPDFYEISKTVSNYEERKMNLENKIQALTDDNSEKAKRDLKKLKKMDTYGDLNFEALIIFAQNFQEISNFSSILPYYDVDPKQVQYIGNSLWAKSKSLKEPGLVNGYFTSLNLDRRKKFEDDYSDIFNSKPHSLATLMFDIVGLISKLHSDKSIFSIDKLYASSGFIGVDGWFKLMPEGKVLRKPRIYKIKNQDFILID